MRWRAVTNWLYGPLKEGLGADLSDTGVATKIEEVDQPDKAVEIPYRDFVENVSKKRPSLVISNRDTSHATIVLERLFLEAKDSVKILTKELVNEVYGTPEVIAAARGFFARGGSLYVLTEVNISSRENRLLELAEMVAPPERLRVVTIPDAVQESYTYHFTVVDNDSYRFESEKNTWRADVQFGPSKLGATLALIFDKILNLSSSPAA